MMHPNPENLEKIYDTTNKRRLDIIASDLSDTPDPFVTVNDIPNWNEVKAPDTGEAFDASVPVETIASEYEAELEMDNRANIAAVLGPLLVYSGIQPTDHSSQDWCRIGTEFSPSSTYPYATMELWDRRVPVRAIPGSWSTDSRLATPLKLQSNRTSSSGLEVVYSQDGIEFRVGEPTKLLPPDSLRVLAYKRRHQVNGEGDDFSITINPIQTCPIRCDFCFRGYDRINGKNGEVAEKVDLVNLSAKQIAEHIGLKFKEDGWSNLRQIALLSGAFSSFDALHDYVESFVSEIMRVTRGEFNPIKNMDQRIHTLTHLARTKEHYRALHSLGLKSLEDTVEIIDQETRTRVMRRAKPNNTTVTQKSAHNFEEILDSVVAATEIYGEDYSTTLILGLDTFEVTRDALLRLREAGLKSLSYPIYQAYGIADTSLQRMSFSEIMQSRRLATHLFTRIS